MIYVTPRTITDVAIVCDCSPAIQKDYRTHVIVTEPMLGQRGRYILKCNSSMAIAQEERKFRDRIAFDVQ